MRFLKPFKLNKTKTAGDVSISLMGLFITLLMAFIFVLVLQIQQLNLLYEETDEALSLSVLSSAVINREDAYTMQQTVIHEAGDFDGDITSDVALNLLGNSNDKYLQEAYNYFMQTFSDNFRLDEDLIPKNPMINSRVDIVEYNVYNVWHELNEEGYRTGNFRTCRHVYDPSSGLWETIWYPLNQTITVPDALTQTNIPVECTMVSAQIKITVTKLPFIANVFDNGFLTQDVYYVRNADILEHEDLVNDREDADIIIPPGTLGIPYSVRHHWQNIADDNYTMAEFEEYMGNAGDEVTPAVKYYEGFTSPETQTIVISSDGRSIVNYYYTRNQYKLTINGSEGISNVSYKSYDRNVEGAHNNSLTVDIKYSEKVNIGANVSNGYSWANWNGTYITNEKDHLLNMPAKDVTVTAYATPIVYSIDYVLNGGVQGNNPVYSYTIKDTVVLPIPSKVGYTFEGWYTNSSLEGDQIESFSGEYGNKVFYAKWDAIEYSITYVPNGGTMPENVPTTYTVDNPVTHPIPTREEYEFAGWYENEDLSGDPVTSTKGAIGDKTYYAKWEKIVTYAAVYDGTQLVFGKAESIPVTYTYTDNEGNQKIGTLTEGWTGIATKNYELVYNSDMEDDVSTVPWTPYIFDITDVNVIDEIVPINTVGWFMQMWNCKNMNLENLNTERVTDMHHMFYFTGQSVLDDFTITGLDNWNVGKVEDMSYMFTHCGSQAPECFIGDLTNWNVENVKDMSYMFNQAGYSANYWSIGDIRNWNVSNVEYMTSMFESMALSATNFTELDLSGWDVSNVADMNWMFYRTANTSLEVIQTPYNIPSNVYINAITSKDFYDVNEDYKLYKAGTFPTDIDESHTLFATLPDAYAAVYDGTQLVFGRGLKVPTTYSYEDAEGTTRLGTLTESWTGIETLVTTNASRPPWYKNYKSSITAVNAVNEIRPINMAYWFYEFNKCSTMDLTKINTSKVTSMKYTFYSVGTKANEINIYGISNWDVSNTINMYGTFNKLGDSGNVKKINIGDLSNWDVGNVENFAFTFFNFGEHAPINVYIGDLSNWDVSSAKDMEDMFCKFGVNSSVIDIGDLSNWDVSNVEDMQAMFSYLGVNAFDFNIGNLDNWDVSNVKNMRSMFEYAGINSSTWNIGDISKWDTSSVEYMNRMFVMAGNKTSEFDIGDLSTKIVNKGTENEYTAWDTSNVIDMNYMFSSAGSLASTFDIGNVGTWNVGSVTNMDHMFHGAGCKSTTWYIGDLSNWDVSSVKNMSSMFHEACYVAPEFSIGNLDNWDVSNVENMSNMFYYLGREETNWSIGDLSDWNVSNVTNMNQMFLGTGRNSVSYNIGNLDNWNTSKVTNMYQMFRNAGYVATEEWNIGDLSTKIVNEGTENEYIAWDTSSVTNMTQMFFYAGNKAYVPKIDIGDIGTWNVNGLTSLTEMFYGFGSNASIFNFGNLSNWDVSNVTSMNGTFGVTGTNATNFTELDLSGWDASNITDMGAAFTSTRSLKIIKTPYNISSEVSIADITSWVYYDLSDNNKRYPSGTFPIGITESHILSRTKDPQNEVTYHVDENEIYTEMVTYNKSVLNPATFTPSKEGYTFVGWRLDDTADNLVLTDMTMEVRPINLYAVFHKDITVYTYDYKSEYVQTSNIYYNNGNRVGGTIELHTADGIDGYTFRGYTLYNSKESIVIDSKSRVDYSGGETISLDNDAYLVATYEGELVTLTYYNNSTTASTIADTKGYEGYGRNFTNPTFTIAQESKDGWTERGWATDTTGNADIVYSNLDNTEISTDTTLYGCYERQVTLFYHGNGADSGSVDSQTASRYYNSTGNYTDAAFTLAENGFNKINCLFDGWDLGYPGETITLTSDTITYALWTQGKVTVTYDANGGKFVSSYVVTYNANKGTFLPSYTVIYDANKGYFKRFLPYNNYSRLYAVE